MDIILDLSGKLMVFETEMNLDLAPAFFLNSPSPVDNSGPSGFKLFGFQHQLNIRTIQTILQMTRFGKY